MYDVHQRTKPKTFTALFVAVAIAAPTPASAQTTNSTVNFQARLLQSSGALVPDGNYHIEFKIYDSLSSGVTARGVCTGNCLWMETRTTGNLVRVVNGYFSVNLGSVTGFSSTTTYTFDYIVIQ